MFPSRVSENFPLVGLEAMSCGTVILASKRGFSEYVKDNYDGVLIDPGQPEQLIQSIRGLMDDDDKRRRLEIAAREKALLYDWKIILNEYRKLYEEV